MGPKLLIPVSLALLLWWAPAEAQENVRFSIYYSQSSLTSALEEDILSAAGWEGTGLRPEIVAASQPYMVALKEGLADIVYVPVAIAQTQAVNPSGFSDILSQPFGAIDADRLARSLSGPFRDFLLADLEHDEAYALSLASLGSTSLVARGPFDGMQRVSGQKWALAGPVDRQFNLLGVSPQIIAESELEAAFYAGAVDAVEISSVEGVDRLTREASDLSVLTDFQPVVAAAITREGFWDYITEDQRLGIEKILALVEERSLVRSSQASIKFNATLMERNVSLVATFGEVLEPNLEKELRGYWVSDSKSRPFVLQVFDAAVEQSSDRDQPPQKRLPSPNDRGAVEDGKIWFATDRTLMQNPRSFSVTFGNRQAPAAEANYYCGVIRWKRDDSRKPGVPVNQDNLEFDGSIVRDGECDGLLDSATKASGARAMVFIHGYNTKFPDAAARAAALKEDLGWAAPTILWSWPSRGLKGAYKKDGKASESSRWRLIPFLRSLGTAGFDHVEIITHSMGGRLGVNALAFAGSETPNPFTRFVFVAPDVSTGDFSGAVSASNFAGNIVLYANEHDRALMASMIKNDESRAGLAGYYSIMLDGLETIDASEIDFEPLPELNHAHAFDVAEGLADLKARLADDEPAPGERNLRQEPGNGPAHRWMIELDPQLRASR